MRCVHVGGNNYLLFLLWCRCSDRGGLAFLLDNFLAKYLNPDGFGVLPQKDRQVSRVGESKQIRKRHGFDLVSWMGSEKRMPGCGQVRVFVPSLSLPNVSQIRVDEPPIVMWEIR